MSMKNPPTPAGIEPATFRFVAQHLNHCATAVPRPATKCINKCKYCVLLQIKRVSLWYEYMKVEQSVPNKWLVKTK